MKLLLSTGLGLTAALVYLDLHKFPLWGLHRGKDDGGGLSKPGILAWFSKIARLRRSGDMPWDEICADLAFRVKAGNTLVQAIRAVAQEGTSPAHGKLGKAYQLYETGVPVIDALHMVAQGDTDLHIISAILEIGSISGGDTASLLWRVFEILRRRRAFRGEAQARLSEARITAWLLLCLPWVIGFFLFRYEPHLVRQFAASPQGRAMVIAGMVLWALGGVLISMLLRSACPAYAHARAYHPSGRGGKLS